MEEPRSEDVSKLIIEQVRCMLQGIGDIAATYISFARLELSHSFLDNYTLNT